MHTSADRRHAPARSARDLPKKDVSQAPGQPPPPPSPYRPASTTSYRDDHTRRGSTGTALPPRTFSPTQPSSLGLTHTSAPVEPQQPPFSSGPLNFLNRHMPPPSASPQQSPVAMHNNNPGRPPLPTPPPPLYLGTRAPPSAFNNRRPSSSMSISSIMAAADPSEQGRRPDRLSVVSRNNNSTQSPFSMPPSPHYRSHAEHNSTFERQPPTPESASRDPNNPRPFDPLPARAQSSAPSTHYPEMSPNSIRQHNSTIPPPYGAISPVGGTVPPRPYSQPVGVEAGVRDQKSGEGSERPGESQKRKYDDDMSDRRNGGLDKPVRDRALSDLDGRRSYIFGGPPPRPAQHSPLYPGARAPPPPSNGNLPEAIQTQSQPLPANDSRHLSDTNVSIGGPFQRLFSPPTTTSPFAAPGRGSGVVFGSLTHTGQGLEPRPAERKAESAATHLGSLDGDRNETAVKSPASGARGGSRPRTPVLDWQLRKSIEETHAVQQRSFLGWAGDPRRDARGSPLPQAVQGAQGAPVGSGRDPSIKSEFGRMFSGLGSGVGSTPQPTMNHIAQPPSRHSPASELGEAEHHEKRQNENGVGVNGGRNARKGPSRMTEESRMDNEDGRSASGPQTARDGRTSKSNFASHHHHHHPHNHQ